MNVAKFKPNMMVRGARYGMFLIVSRKWSEQMQEWVYSVRQIEERDGRKTLSAKMTLVESCFGGKA